MSAVAHAASRVNTAEQERDSWGVYELMVAPEQRHRMQHAIRGVAARAWLVDQITKCAPEQRGAFHGNPPAGSKFVVRPYALAVLPATMSLLMDVPVGTPNASRLVRVTTLNAAATEALNEVWESTPVGHSMGEIERALRIVVGSASRVIHDISADWLVLDSLPLAPKGIRFVFQTPTAFNSTRQRVSFVPTIPLLFEGLAQRFDVLRPGKLPESPDAITSRISRAFIQRRTDVVVPEDDRHNPEIGFLGECLLEVRRTRDPDHEAIRWAFALARFASVAGLGMETTRGMGCVSTEYVM